MNLWSSLARLTGFCAGTLGLRALFNSPAFALGATSSWDPQAVCKYGALIGREVRAQGMNMTLGGGVNLTREPRDGRTFEYAGEDRVAISLSSRLGHCSLLQPTPRSVFHRSLI
jgi:hypothetical protein